ncbi:helix-turn-helix transcriptional regulator [Bacillus sp. CH30_1T]|uniref:AraC family transcriptional regulator n=1 Tax=Bacillus sp. CH30_1T TaxID=2604836 RepID=UPI0011F08D45|nr:AraC family transcriptional regulator [Bacillus sp. CH30_1T]KAA0566651.1 helix-turn-helix transcriptional regulator [Bacillus sp. CH30_1T]
MDRSNQVICDKRSYSRDIQSHQHDFGQFLFPLQGSLDIKTNMQEFNLTSEYCFYLPPLYSHDFRSTDRNEFLTLDIPEHFLPGDTESMYVRLDESWASIRFLLLEESKNKRGSSDALKDLTRYVTHKLKTNPFASIEYIHHHYKESLSLDTLAAIEHYHPVYYSAWFKRKTGKSPKMYITELRLQEAKQLLMTTSWSMSAISEEIGFENSSSFTRWFVKWEGTTPQTYRMIKNG